MGHIFFPFVPFYLSLRDGCSSIVFFFIPPIVLSVKYSSTHTVNRRVFTCRVFVHAEHRHNVITYTGLLLTYEITGFFRFLSKCGFVLWKMHQTNDSFRNCLSPFALPSLHFDLFFGSSCRAKFIPEERNYDFSRRFSVSTFAILFFVWPLVSRVISWCGYVVQSRVHLPECWFHHSLKYCVKNLWESNVLELKITLFKILWNKVVLSLPDTYKEFKNCLHFCLESHHSALVSFSWLKALNTLTSVGL